MGAEHARWRVRAGSGGSARAAADGALEPGKLRLPRERCSSAGQRFEALLLLLRAFLGCCWEPDRSRCSHPCPDPLRVALAGAVPTLSACPGARFTRFAMAKRGFAASRAALLPLTLQ